MNENEKYIDEVFGKVEKKDMQIPEKDGKEASGLLWEIILTVLFALMTLFILGIYELFSSGWDWSIYQSSDFWIRYGLLQGASWFARIWIYVIRVKHHERTDKAYLSLEEDLQEFVNADFETPFIETDANADDFERKKRSWINKQKLKLIKFANKYQITNILPSVKKVNELEFDMHGFQLKSDKKMSQRTEKRVNRKITNILKTIRNDWCEQNLEAVKVRYNKVSRTILTSGYVSNRSGDGSPDYKKNSAKTFINSTVPAFLFVSAFMFLIVPLTGDMDNSADAWFKFLTNFMLVLGSGAMMWYNSPELFRQTSRKAMSERVGTLNNYAKKRGIKIKKDK
jgi:hypothetical protein